MGEVVNVIRPSVFANWCLLIGSCLPTETGRRATISLDYINKGELPEKDILGLLQLARDLHLKWSGKEFIIVKFLE